MKRQSDFLTVKYDCVVGFAENIPEHLSIPEGVKGIGRHLSVSYERGAFRGCTTLKSVVIPNSPLYQL